MLGHWEAVSSFSPDLSAGDRFSCQVDVGQIGLHAPTSKIEEE